MLHFAAKKMPLSFDLGFSLFLVILVVLERVVNAHVTLIYRLVFNASSRDNALKGYASTQLVGAGYTFLSSFLSGITSSAVNVLASLSSYALVVATGFVVFAALFMLQEHYSTLLLGMVDGWNASFGPVLYRILFFPLQIGNILFTSIIPVFNSVVWLLKLLFHNVLLKTATSNSDSILAIGRSVADLAKNLFIQFPGYFTTIVSPCPSPVSDLCYEPGIGNRTLDFITPMRDVRSIAASLLTIFINACGNGAGLADIILFPLLDINLAKGVHNIVNAILYTVLQIPSVTVQRCLNNNKDLIMCLPDFEPPFNMLVAGIRNVGMMFDNWLDVSSIIVEKSFGFDPEAECEVQAKLLSPAAYSRDVFGTNRTIVVGMTAGLYAVTDGVHVQYFNHYDGVDTLVTPNAWPIPIDVRYGVAAVTYTTEQRDGSTGDTTTTMLGCRCLDNDGLPPMRIQCALALKEPIFSGFDGMANVFDVVFQQRSTADYMTCRMAQISIQSVRWPASRFVSANEDTYAVTYSLSRSVVDATIWVSPLCTSRASKVPEVCMPLFKAAACYPYCMASRLQGSGSDGLVLYNANEWRDRVHLMNRDCSVAQMQDPKTARSESGASFLPNGTQGSSSSAFLKESVETSSTVTPVRGSSLVFQKWDPASGKCVLASNSVSMLGTDVMQQLRGTSGNSNAFRSILVPGQPFAYAGIYAHTHTHTFFEFDDMLLD